MRKPRSPFIPRKLGATLNSSYREDANKKMPSKTQKQNKKPPNLYIWILDRGCKKSEFGQNECGNGACNLPTEERTIIVLCHLNTGAAHRNTYVSVRNEMLIVLLTNK